MGDVFCLLSTVLWYNTITAKPCPPHELFVNSAEWIASVLERQKAPINVGAFCLCVVKEREKWEIYDTFLGTII